MAYGIEITNSSGVLQIDETHINFGLIQSGTATCSTNPPLYGTSYSTTISTSAPTSYALIAVHTNGNLIGLSQVVVGVSNTTWTFQGPQNASFIYYIFDIAPESNTGYGFQVLNASGDVTFNSNYPPMSVKAFGSSTNSLSSGPVYAALIEAPGRKSDSTFTGYVSGIGGSYQAEYRYDYYIQGVKTTSTGAQSADLLTSSQTTTIGPGPIFSDITRKLAVVDVTNMGTQPGVTATYAINPNVTSVNEGSTVTFTVTTTNVGDSTVLYWTTTGSASSADFSDSTTQGTVTITSNSGTITRTLSNDLSVSEGEENFSLDLRTTGYTGTIVAESPYVVINDTSQAAPTYSINAPADITEGTAATVTVTTTNVPDGTPLYWKVEPAADFGTTTGSVTMVSNSATFSITATDDGVAETETGTVRLYTDSSRTVQVATDTFNILDAGTVSTITIASSGVTYGYDNYVSGGKGSISGFTAIGSDTIARIDTLYIPGFFGDPDTYYVNVAIEGDHTSTPNWTSITFNDITGTPSLSESSVTPSYDSGNGVTFWAFESTSTTSTEYKVYTDWSGNTGNTSDVEWTI